MLLKGRGADVQAALESRRAGSFDKRRFHPESQAKKSGEGGGCKFCTSRWSFLEKFPEHLWRLRVELPRCSERRVLCYAILPMKFKPNLSMSAENQSGFSFSFPRRASIGAAVCFFVVFRFGAVTAEAQTSITSIGQPIQLVLGTEPGQIPLFSGTFSVDADEFPDFNYIQLESAHDTLGGNSGSFIAGLRGVTGNYSHTLSNYTLTAGNHISSLPFSFLSSGQSLTDTRSSTNTGSGTSFLTLFDNSQLYSADAQTFPDGPVPVGVGIDYAALAPTKTFNFNTIRGSSTLQLSANFPQGAGVGMRLQISDADRTQVNTSDRLLRVQPGFVTTDSFSTGNTSLFRWDLKGNTESGAGTNWTQINFADKVATFTEGTQFVIAFDTTTNFLDPFWSQSRSWDIFNGGSITGAGADDFLANLNFTFIGGLNRPSDIPNGYNASKFSFDQTTGTLNWTAIPEPTSALSGILLAAGLMRRRRR